MTAMIQINKFNISQEMSLNLPGLMSFSFSFFYPWHGVYPSEGRYYGVHMIFFCVNHPQMEKQLIPQQN